MKARPWKCRKCSATNQPRTRKCVCGKLKPPKRKPPHMAALAVPYEQYVALNGGLEVCGICGKRPSAARRLDRDHDHRGTGTPRGLLCGGNQGCNKRLGLVDDPAWLRAAADYLDRANEREAA